MIAKVVAPGLALVSLASAAKQCINQTVSVDVEARNAEFASWALPHSNIDVTWFVQNQTRQGHNFTDEALTGYHDVTGTWNSSTQFCWDDEKTPENPTLQILTHGIGFDKTYWDLSINDFNYSYVNAALDAGFVTLSHDRLGVAKSEHGDPLNEIQTNLEVSALRSLTAQLRAGTFPNVDTAYDTIVHVGHSYGSIQSYTLSAYYPDETQGIVLTGFSTNSSFNHLFAAAANLKLASLSPPKAVPDQELPDGYIISGDKSANQYNFFAPPFFDPALLDYAEDSKQPLTVGELLTLGSAPATSPFTGPVLVFTGDADLPFCGGDCLATGGAAASVLESVKDSFPDIDDDDFLAYVQPNTGHGVTAHYNATAGYKFIQDWLSDHDL